MHFKRCKKKKELILMCAVISELRVFVCLDSMMIELSRNCMVYGHSEGFVLRETVCFAEFLTACDGLSGFPNGR